MEQMELKMRFVPPTKYYREHIIADISAHYVPTFYTFLHF